MKIRDFKIRDYCVNRTIVKFEVQENFMPVIRSHPYTTTLWLYTEDKSKVYRLDANVDFPAQTALVVKEKRI